MHTTLTILLPYFNERGWLGRTIGSLAAQTDQRFELVLIDNASTDDSAAEARAAAASFGARARHIQVEQPGKTQALAASLPQVTTAYVAVCDADTLYPPQYVANILALFAEDPAAAAVMAIDLYAGVDEPTSRRRIARVLRKVRRRPWHCHAGGYAQAFRTDALKAAGGFDPARWGYVMEDHEVVQQVLQFGRARYAAEHFCFPSARRKDRSRVSWSGFERLVYRLTPRAGLDWFFYRFLAHRLHARRFQAAVLREKTWEPRLR